ncbi:MAG TPA: FmdB family zinc ribbon protein [Acidimicrobiales bacterium]|nr:FmdB family zinc ribbon protein [Acidimicrobiales bacterium]
MPTYEYACKACGEHLEVVQSFKDNALTECPACGGPLRKVFGNIGVAFKGSGFYKTDSRSETGKGAHKAGEPKTAEAGAATKSEGSKSEGSKSEGSKSEGSKSEGSKSDGSKAAPASNGPSKSGGSSSKVAAAS